MHFKKTLYVRSLGRARSRPRKTLIAGACLMGLSVAPAFAIFGIGDIVFDPSNYAEALQQLVQLEQQYSQLVQTYQMVSNQYQEMLRMAKQVPVNMVSRYRALATPWTPSSAANTYGTTSGWSQGITTGQSVASGYASAIQKLQDYGSALGNIPADQQARVKSEYGTVELADGANLSAIQTIGQMRGNSAAVELAIQNLESDSLSSNPNRNTEIAVLNKINAANVIALRNSQDANKLLVALAESQVVDAKRKRDAEATAINSHIRFVSDGQAAMAAQATGASDAMRNWRMP